MKPIIRFLTLLALFSAPHLASAYYDPGVQRWISRDPVGERGFQAARQSKRSTGRNELNLFLFVGNTPNHDIDAYGLQRVDPDTSIDECLSNCDWDWKERKRKSISVGWRCAGYIVGGIVGTAGGGLCCVGAVPVGVPVAVAGFGFDIALWIVDAKKDEKFDRQNQADWVKCCKACGKKYPGDQDEADDHIKRNHRGGPIW